MTIQILRSWRIVYGILLLILVYFIHQDQFWLIAGLFGLIFGIYIILGLQLKDNVPSDTQINLILKIAIVFAFPLASDDIYRFYWDGCTLLDGVSPFHYKPTELIQFHPSPWQLHYSQLNSKEHYSVYPPILQVLFAVCSFLSFHSIYIFSILWKGILLLADFGTIQLFKKSSFAQNKNIEYWYSWNPLLIYEVLGNGHPEGLMIYFIVSSIYYLKTNKETQSSIMLGLAAAIKLFPIGLLLFFIKNFDLKSSLRYSLLCIGIFALCMISIYPFQMNFLDSIQLYFVNFEFNGSFFLLWKALDYYRFGFDNVDHIAPYLSILFLIYSLVLFFKQKNQNQVSLLNTLFYAWLGYLILSTTVHPWYVLPVMVLGLIAEQYWILIWSGTVILSYSWYDEDISTDLKYAFIILEYIAWIIFMFWGLSKKSKPDPNN